MKYMGKEFTTFDTFEYAGYKYEWIRIMQFFPDLGIIKKIFYIKENLTVDLHNKTLSEEINFLLQFLNDFFVGFRVHLHIEETFILL